MSEIESTGCCSAAAVLSGCRLEAILAIDERGQMVLPKDVRERAGISAGDKLAIVSWERTGKVCCLSLLKADMLTEVLSTTLNTLMGKTVESVALVEPQLVK